VLVLVEVQDLLGQLLTCKIAFNGFEWIIELLSCSFKSVISLEVFLWYSQT